MKLVPKRISRVTLNLFKIHSAWYPIAVTNSFMATVTVVFPTTGSHSEASQIQGRQGFVRTNKVCPECDRKSHYRKMKTTH